MKYIIEVANTHGGDKKYLLGLIQEFVNFKGHGIKFQPLHPDRIATSDFEWFNVYQELLFNPEEWHEIITEAKKTKLVWLDLFDTYGVEILNQNLKSIHGIKLQASILYNEEVIKALEQTDCSKLKLIVNITKLLKVFVSDVENFHKNDKQRPSPYIRNITTDAGSEFKILSY